MTETTSNLVGVTRKPMTGHHYTMGAMKHSCGDRSYINHIWKVLETNGAAALIVDPFADESRTFAGKPQVVAVDEFDWTPADELADALTLTRKGEG
ncbi:MAG TPA: hypothetical protein DF966_18290 [Sulfitobacter sp.]|nr:hypothetical protein [Sulfitobacter sp.]|tara:strand:+ start:1070 stop:1357 length:288 start_codon:yes stop_codon:yes gene_type:complete